MVAQPLLDKIGDGTPNEDDPDDFDLSSDVLLYGMIHDLLEYVDYLENVLGTRRTYRSLFSRKKEV